MNVKTSKFFVINIILMVGLVVKCNPFSFVNNQSADTTPAKPMISSATITPSPTFSPTPTLKMRPTRIGTNTPSPQPPTLTPQPTLSSDEAERLVIKLFKDNGGCKLPCWWGFIPGKTAWSDARRFLSRFAILNPLVDEEKYKFTMDILVPVTKIIFVSPLPQYYQVQGGLVDSMRVFPGYTDVYPLHSFLSDYGTPAEVWISTYSNKYRGFIPFWLYYSIQTKE